MEGWRSNSRRFDRFLLDDCLFEYIKTCYVLLNWEESIRRVPESIGPEKIQALIAAFKKHGNLKESAKDSQVHPQTAKKYLERNGLWRGRFLKTPKKKTQKVVYFTDSHDRIELDKDRFLWLGKLCAREKPDYLVCGGDIFDVDSLNAHSRNETHDGKLKPGFAAELSSLSLALGAIDENCPKSVIKCITLGNHENRIHRYENNNPECYGILSASFYDLLELHKWEITPFKQYLNIGGVEFTHAPINAMGKEIGGKGATLRIATDSLRSVVFGHTHKREDASAAKLGPDNRHVRAYNGGVFLPDGYRMDYSKASQNRWDYGLTVMTIKDGTIDELKWVSMGAIRDSYA